MVSKAIYEIVSSLKESEAILMALLNLQDFHTKLSRTYYALLI